MKTRAGFRTGQCAIVVLAVAGSMRLIPAETEGSPEVSGSVVVGGETIDHPTESSKFQEFREVPNGFFVESFLFGLSQSDWKLDVETFDLLQDDQRILGTFWKGGTFRADLGYVQNPKWYSNTTATLFVGHGETSLALPDPMRQQLEALGSGPATSSALRGYLAGSQPFDLRYRRDRLYADALYTPGNWSVGGGYSEERRGDTRPLSMGTYFSAGDITEIAAPQDYTTRNASFGAEYVTDRFRAGMQVGYSDFTNDTRGTSTAGGFEDALVVDNPLRFTDATTGPNAAAAKFLISTPPDNDSAWVELTGGMRVGAWGRIDAQASVRRSEQDNAFLPFSLNSAVPPPADPRGLVVLEGHLASGTPVTRYDGRVDTFLYDVRFTGRPLRWLGFKAFWHYYDYDNKTPQYTVTDYVKADTSLEGTARSALPFAWKKQNLGADATFRVTRALGLLAGYERERWDRKFRNAPRTDEDIFKAGADWKPSEWASVRFDYRRGDRKFDTYDESTFFGEEAFPEGEPVANAVVKDQRLFDLANRTQDRADLMLDFTPIDRFSFGVTATGMKNDYSDTVLGRTEDKTWGVALDFNVVVSEAVSIWGDCGHDSFRYDLASRYRPVVAGAAVDDPVNDWFSKIEDKTKSYGLGFEARLAPNRWLLNGRAAVTDSRGESHSSFVAGGDPAGDAESFPDVKNKLTHAELNLRYLPMQKLWIALGYVYEKWDEEDFARDVMKPFMGAVDPGAGESVFLGWRVPDYSVNIFSARLGYTF